MCIQIYTLIPPYGHWLLLTVLYKKTRKFVFVKSAKPKDKKKKFSRYVIMVIRKISTKGTFDGKYFVETRGIYICDILLDFYTKVESISFPEVISLVSMVF